MSRTAIDPKDYLNKEYNDWTIKEYVGVGFKTQQVFLCECKCGNRCNVILASVVRGKSKRCVKCGCEKTKQALIKRAKLKRNKLKNTVKGNWRLIFHVDKSIWECECIYCGKRKKVYMHYMGKCQCQRPPTHKEKLLQYLIDRGDDKKQVLERVNSITRERHRQLVNKYGLNK